MGERESYVLAEHPRRGDVGELAGNVAAVREDGQQVTAAVSDTRERRVDPARVGYCEQRREHRAAQADKEHPRIHRELDADERDQRRSLQQPDVDDRRPRVVPQPAVRRVAADEVVGWAIAGWVAGDI